ncbi:Crp/Fnr family transcriptional regulator [Rhabdobacter roseus]|uniref:CRP-like cAMP-binding protein n=1 Tax=Rhabdobacter roseus TaxID=1655419 RepID=A0A840TJD5_9BACT|nr:Crp/Fnr family transcriptional regulator [Rhabdobacter roseus]MBB5281907.1 CRP-like cAMP-binding protein [Rhabdobacter roseus]
MTDIEVLSRALRDFAQIDEAAFALSSTYWQPKVYRKGEFYNEQRNICRNLGFVLDGVFRIYYTDDPSGDDKNIFFFSENQVITSFKSFVTQTPCKYYTQAMTDARVLLIGIEQLRYLYEVSHPWERFGRMIAEYAFNLVMDKNEGFLFKTPEERYLELVAQHPRILQTIPLYHISSYLGIQGPSLSRIRKRLSQR